MRENLDIGPGWVDEYRRCPSPYGYGKRKKRSIAPWYSSNDYVDSEKAFAVSANLLINSSIV